MMAALPGDGAIAAAKVSAAIPTRAFEGMSAMFFLRRFVEDIAAHNQHPSAEPSPQRFLGHKGNYRYLASIEFNRRRRERHPTLVEMTASGKLG
jgi:hypothetical protein